MKRLVKKLCRSRFFWFVAGLSLLPALSFLRYLAWPTPVDALGWWPGYYEENYVFFPFPHDYSYYLKFHGSQLDFERYARKLGMEHLRISDDEYKEGDEEGGRRVSRSADGIIEYRAFRQ